MTVYRALPSTITTSGTSTNTCVISTVPTSTVPTTSLYGNSASNNTVPMVLGSGFSSDKVVAFPYVPDDIEISDGRERSITMPDGALIRVAKDGSYTIDDANAKVVYRACRVRDFNTFLNASDKIEDFIRYCGGVGIRQDDVLGIPIKQFIQWLVIEAAKADGEEPPALLQDLRKPRCIQCGRFMSPTKKAKGIQHCRVQCFERANNTQGKIDGIRK